MEPIPLECRLDLDGLREQKRRYERVSASIETVHRGPTELTAQLTADVDEGLVSELVATERECCPFFTIDWDRGARNLSFAGAAEHADALDAIAYALSASR